ncbi:MAG: hypothetical protein K6T86_20315 [Pirellulales bacterium]|nr:hypothetical protein [Pirellulales bacterium]
MHGRRKRRLLVLAALLAALALPHVAQARSFAQYLGIGHGPGYHCGCFGYDPWGSVGLSYQNPCCHHPWATYGRERPWCCWSGYRLY